MYSENGSSFNGTALPERETLILDRGLLVKQRFSLLSLNTGYGRRSFSNSCSNLRGTFYKHHIAVY